MKIKKRGDLRQLAPRKKLLKTVGDISADLNEDFYEKPFVQFSTKGFLFCFVEVKVVRLKTSFGRQKTVELILSPEREGKNRISKNAKPNE